ncbi:LON-domain-containing protein [Meira miltonrushii]|uniref:LON-domain-containing protein n=1 Tax=Meira miltonrushii TaxID=1280837 RepID=A0A316VI56_9BASI|nr:LON-domain-containing protein [Meira miltonrushii]PWN36728.1 LON-domain-containing protein [Meira miltonrushii]
MTAPNEHAKLSAKDVGELNLVPPPAVSSAAQVMVADMDFLNAPRMSARTLALHLLQLTECPSCHQPVQEPVTLPCGHSSCLACIMQMGRSSDEMADSAVLMPSTSHLPPRLPLATTVVACPLTGCSRSAIGRGLGMWKGHLATFGAGSTQQNQSLSSTADDAIDGPGELPLDGFVVPTNRDSSSLSVIRPQRRESFSSKYAISKYGTEGQHITKESSLLRTDVTLSKAIDTLRRFANIPDMPTYLPQRQSQSTLHRGAGSSRGRRRTRGNRQKLHTRSTQDDTRTQIDERFLAVMGASEEGVDSGTIGGVSAVVESSTEDEEDESDDHSHEEFESDYDEHAYDGGIRTSLATDEDFFDDDDDEIGGAFARQDENRKSEKRVRRHTLQRQSISHTQLPHGSLAETIKEAELDDDEALEQPFSSRQLVLDSLHTDMMDIMECQLCYMLLYQPLTTPCGHTFCRRCFSRSLDHSTSCPLCRTDMPPFSFFQEHPCSSTLVKLMTASITRKEKEEGIAEVAEGADINIWGMANMYQERKLAIENEERESLLSTPIFVCTLGFPFMPTILHIFEPRYRLMIRRCLESGHPRFGMVMHSQDMSTSTPGMSSYGTMLEIKTVKMLPDGRSMIETVGSHRFRVMENGSLDGYSVGRIERVDDVPAEAEHDLEQASMGNFSLWNESSPRSSDRGNRSSESGNVSGSSGDSFSPSSANSSTMMTMAEAREAHAAFQAAIGLDSLNRHAAADEPRRPTTVNAAATFVQRPIAELIGVCRSFIETLRSGSAPWLMTRLNDTYGPMPDPSNVAAFGYWMALVMPIDEHEKAKLLPIRSSRLRLCIVVYWIEQLRQTWWFNHGCSIQ